MIMTVVEIARNTVDKAIQMGASQAEVTTSETNVALTRYTKNKIHQNVAQLKNLVNIEVVVGKDKRGSTSVNTFDPKSIDESIENAIKIAKISTPDTDFVSFPEPRLIDPLPGIYVKGTAELSPEDMAEGVKTLIDTAMDYDKLVKWSTGAYTKEHAVLAVANSLGVAAESELSRASVDIVSKAGEEEDGSGVRAAYAHDYERFDLETMAKEAAEDAVNGINPQLIPTGEYEAVFTPTCVSTFTMFMGRLGFSAKAYQEGYSCFTDKIGSQVFDEKLTIHDKGRSLETYNALPFDGEGVPKTTLRLVNKGVPENLCYDNYHAVKDGTESTGHALPKSMSRWFRGIPLPMNMVLQPGNSNVDEMIEETKKGVLISRLHYVNAIRNDLAIISGLTRDACWLIENGEIRYPIKVMRFTDSVLDVMSNVDMIGDDTTVQMLSSATLPAVKVAKFKFTGQSEF
jgi:predicted Zn-dependent protease